MTTDDLREKAHARAADALRIRLGWASLHWGVESVSPDAWPHLASAVADAVLAAVDPDGLRARNEHLDRLTVSLYREAAELRSLLAGAADIIESLRNLIFDRHALYAEAVKAGQIPAGAPELIRLDEVLTVLLAGVSVGLDEPPTVTRE